MTRFHQNETARDQERYARLRQPPIPLSQGAEWKALISRHIETIPVSGDACVAEQIMSRGPPRTPVSNAMAPKVGAAARHTQSAAPRPSHSSRIPMLSVVMASHSCRRVSCDRLETMVDSRE